MSLCGEDGLCFPAWVGQCVGNVRSGEHECVVTRQGFSLAWITLSDKGSRGERVDTSGPAIRCPGYLPGQGRHHSGRAASAQGGPGGRLPAPGF
jgi:hypothetical protein